MINEFAAGAIDKVYGQPKITYRSYNPDSKTMQLRLTSNDGENFQKNITIKVEPAKAKVLKEELSTLSPTVIFDATMHNDGQINFSIVEISFVFDDNFYNASIDDNEDYKLENLYVTIDNAAANFNTSDEELSLQVVESRFQLQTQTDEDIAIGSKGAIVKNELVDTIQTLPYASSDRHKWIFMIAIENYDETNSVLYVNRSAVAVKEALQRRLGISRSHTFALIDSKVTSGAIKDKLRFMLSRVREGDSIYFYYSGHGVTSTSGDMYILPKDKVIDFIDKDPFFKLENIYAMLNASKAKHNFAFIDACFSHKLDETTNESKAKIENLKYNAEKMTIMTSGMQEELSNLYAEKHYRLFSYYLTQALINNVSEVPLLYKQVSTSVIEKSNKMGSKYEQTPQIYGKQNIRLY